jgi:putative transposase
MRNPFRYFKTSPEIIRLSVMFAAEIRKKRSAQIRARMQWRWHLDEVFVRINGETYYLWRAVDHEGEVLEAYVTKKRDRKAALRFLRKAMKRYGRPENIVTDRLRSYRAAMKIIGNAERQETGRWLNNRAENSHQPFRRRERAMAKFRSAKSLQKFASIHSSVHNHFNQDRHLNRRDIFRQNRSAALAEWRQSPQSPRHLQTEPFRRPGRVAPAGGLNSRAPRFLEARSL